MICKHILITCFIAAILLFPVSCFAQTHMAESMASVNASKSLTEVVIEYKLDFLAAKADQQDSDVNSRPGKPALSESDLENEIRKIFSQNEKLYMKTDYPEYIRDIVALIKGKKKKEKALHIYNDHHPGDGITLSRSSSFSMSEGKTTANTTNLKLTVYVLVKGKTKILIPAYSLESNGKIFQTRELMIEL